MNLLLRLIVAHLLADFFLQPHSWIKGRREKGLRSKHLYMHVAVVGISTWVFVAEWRAWPLVLFISLTHFIIDWWKSSKEETIGYFVADQCAHFIILLIGWAWYTGLPSFLISDIIQQLGANHSFWIIVTSYILLFRPAGFLIAKFTKNWQQQLSKGQDDLGGLKNAGTWIGYLERLLILTFILLQQYSAIGFLIAAKSIFRFRAGSENNGRKYAEYIIIGTLFSFSAAVLVGIAALALLR